MPILEANNLRKDFTEGREKVSVLHGISLAVERGEIISLEGPSGSGKTTLLSILGCILTATEGEVRVDGVKVDRSNARVLPEIRKRSVGFVFQQFNLFGALTALENVQYALNLKGQTGEGAEKEANRLLDAVGLEERKNFLPRDLSGGQKQRVAIARALAGGSPIVLADEPTANLDSQTGQQILEVFRQLSKQENRALLVVTHDAKVRAIADRTLFIRDGLLSSN